MSRSAACALLLLGLALSPYAAGGSWQQAPPHHQAAAPAPPARAPGGYYHQAPAAPYYRGAPAAPPHYYAAPAPPRPAYGYAGAPGRPEPAPQPRPPAATVPEGVPRNLSIGDAAQRAQQMNGGGRVLAVDPAPSGYRVRMLKNGEVRSVYVPGNN